MQDRLTMLENRFEDVSEDIREMRGAISKIADSLHKLTAIEERHTSFQESLKSLSDTVDKQDSRITSLETSETLNKLMRYVGGAAGLSVLAFVGEKVLKLL